jgi:hypothetical protein
MPCHAALGEVPLVLKPFANRTIDKSPETVAELIPIAENKLSLIHCLPPACPVGVTTKSFHLRFGCSYAELAENLSHLPQRLDARQGESNAILNNSKRSAARESVSLCGR